MKKFFSFLLITFLLACSISYTPSFANPIPLPNWSDPGITEIINLSDLTGWMQNGGVFDVSNFDNAEDFLTWYFQIRVPYIDDDGIIQSAPAFGNETFNLQPGNSFFTDITNPRGVITNSFREHTGYGRSFQSDFENYSLTGGNLIDMPFQLLDRRSIGNFNLYRYDSLTNYLQNFEFDNPTPNLDPLYSFLQYDNDFYPSSTSNVKYIESGAYTALQSTEFPDSTNNNGYYYAWLSSSRAKEYTFFNKNNISPNGQIWTNSFAISPFTNIYITYDDINTTVNYSGFSTSTYIKFNGSNVYSIQLYNGDPLYDLYGERYWRIYQQYSTASTFTPQTTFSGLSAAINYIHQHFRHYNLYVNGELWVFSGGRSNNVTPEFPDAVGGEDLPVTTWPLHLPKAPAYISGTGIINAIQRAINTDGTFDFGDLQDEITDSDGNPFPINDWEEIPFGDTIPNPNPDDDSVTGTPTPPIPDPDIIPIIPQPIHDAFTGTTILAELVDATQTTLPEELITVFWGIVFILFILGIIKILHK